MCQTLDCDWKMNILRLTSSPKNGWELSWYTLILANKEVLDLQPLQLPSVSVWGSWGGKVSRKPPSKFSKVFNQGIIHDILSGVIG